MDATDEWNAYRARVRAKPDGVSPDETTPIVLRAIVARCGHNKAFRHLIVRSCPAFVWRHLCDQQRHLPLEVLRDLAESGHTFTVYVEYDEIAPADWCED